VTRTVFALGKRVSVGLEFVGWEREHRVHSAVQGRGSSWRELRRVPPIWIAPQADQVAAVTSPSPLFSRQKSK
jgi:hypothetical protein